jgi:predicted alpha/beta-hydrolase family hydrolase
MNFDKIINKEIEGEQIQYGIVFGNEKIVFIKAGADKGISGQGNKYLKMARRVHERMGATVICASNPEAEHKIMDAKAIRWLAAKLGFENFELYFVGTSDGGYQNLVLASKFPETVKILGINSSFIDLPGLVARIKRLPDVEKIFAYGTRDEDYDEVVPVLKKLHLEKLEIVEIEGADHDFTGRSEECVGLVDLL